MIEGQCLCGEHRFELEGPLEMGHHCHCGLCRKHHGSAFATMVGVPAERLTWRRGDVVRFSSSPDFQRESCAKCGTPLPLAPANLPMFVPAGCLGDFDERIEFHIFVASKPDWNDIGDDLPTFDAYPPGVPEPDLPPRNLADAPGGTRGSCLCGHVRYRLHGDALMARHCHCLRCRRARGAAHASNLLAALDRFEWTAGEDRVRSYKLPEAKFFTQAFCGDCGGKAPVVAASRGFVVVPMGSLDDPAPMKPREHIWTSAIPSWSGVFDALPRCAEAPEHPLGPSRGSKIGPPTEKPEH